MFVLSTTLHKTAESEHCMVKPRFFKELFCAVFHPHERYVSLLVTSMNREKNVTLDAHCSRGLDQCLFPFPISLQSNRNVYTYIIAIAISKEEREGELLSPEGGPKLVGAL